MGPEVEEHGSLENLTATDKEVYLRRTINKKKRKNMLIKFINYKKSHTLFKSKK